MLSQLRRRIDAALPVGEILLVVPPFASLEVPSLVGHLLQACVRERGLGMRVLYANIALASVIGEARYQALCEGPGLPGERFFAHPAYGKSLDELYPAEAVPRGAATTEVLQREMPDDVLSLTPSELRALAAIATEFTRIVAECIVARGYRIVGSSTTFEQTSASIALFNALKSVDAQIVTVIGGANCEGPMAEGMAALARSADYVFSGESEAAFPDFLERIARGERPAGRLVRTCEPANIANLPPSDFHEYFVQLEAFVPQSSTLRPEEVWLPYESSRGCWWGEKSQCTFCGLNGATIGYRKKDALRVASEVAQLLETYPSKNVFVCDNIMPREYFTELLPRLEALDGLNMFYEQKSNLTLENLRSLKRAGVNLIQPGIESLSTPLLKLMRKGVSARQHLHLLRNARAVGVSLNWNLLYDFPGDQAEYYEAMLDDLPHIVHLHPPLWLLRLSLDRFSPYFEMPERYGISEVEPLPAYREILPEGIDAAAIAYHFTGHYQSGIRERPELVDRLHAAVAQWRALWKDGRAAPQLAVSAVNDETYLLVDSRYDDKTMRYTFLDASQALQLLEERRVEGSDPDAYAWIRERRLMLEADGHYVPLALGGETLLPGLAPRNASLAIAAV